MKSITLALLVAALVCPAEAARRGGGAGQRKRDKEEEKREKQEQQERERKREAIRAFLDKKDKNHDGSVNRDEYLDGESDKDEAGKKFDRYNKNGDRSLSKSEIAEMLGL